MQKYESATDLAVGEQVTPLFYGHPVGNPGILESYRYVVTTISKAGRVVAQRADKTSTVEGHLNPAACATTFAKGWIF